uniref:Uncharacterized protein n=1 Tax=Clastoptera arizonana TaxID=38151 RepID=A0A1B6C7V4_9HEMI
MKNGIKRGIILVIAVCLPCAWILLQIDIQRESEVLFTPSFHKDNSVKVGFLVDTIGCRIPDLDPFDSSIKKFICTEPRISCDAENKILPLVESNLTSLYVNRAALQAYNVNNEDEFSCCYRPFWRLEVNGSKYPRDVDAKYRYANSCIDFTTEATTEAEFVKVECRLNSTVIYKDFHAFVPLKEHVENRCSVVHNKSAVSVLVVGVDAVSRLNFYRQMPRTAAFLKENFNMVEMFGYNKVEDNTFPNLIPVLTGLSVEELKNTCWPTSNTVFDKCPIIWKNFSSRGYRTMFAEDASWMGTFIYTKRGFQRQPTDYYTRIFNKLSEEEIGNEKRLNANLCIGKRLSAEVLLGYASKFVTTMLNKLSFGFVWGASLTHDFLNLPSYGDRHYVTFFRRLSNLGVFNNTILIFMSDHGIRWGEIRGTYQGYLEERLPFLFVAYPGWFKKKYTTAVSNLRRNAHKLTTPFDLHETLKDLLHLENLEQENIKQRYSTLNETRGISLFLPIFEKRTCHKAGIAEHWCTCHQAVNVPTNHSMVKHSVDFLMKYINNLLLPFPQCSTLTLKEILTSRLEKPTAHLSINTTDAGIQDYMLTVQTVPGNALFEATVRFNANKHTFSLAGSISRINLYGEQSYCVSHFRMKLYCYCKNQK